MDLLRKWEILSTKETVDKVDEEIVFFSASNKIVESYEKSLFAKLNTIMKSSLGSKLGKSKIKFINSLDKNQIGKSYYCACNIMNDLYDILEDEKIDILLKIDNHSVKVSFDEKYFNYESDLPQHFVTLSESNTIKMNVHNGRVDLIFNYNNYVKIKGENLSHEAEL